MDNNLLGEQIAKYRKAAELTQEELGKAVGISAQAVSRWECGGAPDITLLPNIAERLGVSIDTLFGREKGERADVEDTVRQWISTIPKGQRLEQMCRLVWAAIKGMLSYRGVELGDDPCLVYSDHCEQLIEAADGSRVPALVQTSFLFREGIIHDVHAKDFSFATIWPEPEAGYEAFLAPNQVYRHLFQALARPKCLELLELLHSKAARYYVAGTLAAYLSISDGEAEELLEELTSLHLLSRIELELNDGPVHAYTLQESGSFIPFLYLARCLTDHAILVVNYSDREPPMLRGEKWKEA